MNILIIEDEASAARRLKKLIDENYPEFKVKGVTDSIEGSLHWLKVWGQPDLILSDIQLADGLSFDFFKEAKIDCPVVFITAYDEYAIEAFKLNSIDYLLKPVKKEELDKSLKKFLKLQAAQKPSTVDYELLDRMIRQAREPSFQKRLVVRLGRQIKAIEINRIAYFLIDQRMVFLLTDDGQRFPVDYNLDQLMDLLDPGQFFRINRHCIVNYKAIKEMLSYSKSRVKLVLEPLPPSEMIVSKERSPDFKEWLKGH